MKAAHLVHLTSTIIKTGQLGSTVGSRNRMKKAGPREHGRTHYRKSFRRRVLPVTALTGNGCQ